MTTAYTPSPQAQRWCRDGHKFKLTAWKGYWKAKRGDVDGAWWRSMDSTRVWAMVYCERCGETHEICVKDQNARAPEERTTTS